MSDSTEREWLEGLRYEDKFPDDPRIDWGPGEWLAETQRLEAERDAYKAALEDIANHPGYGALSMREVARSVLAGVVSTREKDDERPT